VVEFTKEPKKEFYGVEALFKDDSGNCLSPGQKIKNSNRGKHCFLLRYCVLITAHNINANRRAIPVKNRKI
jgi:hypothetical protein